MYGISNSQQQGGGGGSAASYKAIKATLTPSDWQEVAEQPYFVGSNVIEWATTNGVKTKSQGTNIGLVGGNNYTITIVADGQTYTKTQTAEADGMATLGFQITEDIFVAIYDGVNVSIMEPGTGSMCMVRGVATTTTSFIITSFVGEGLATTIQATISDSAIKVNSAVTMYTNTSEKIAAGEKTNGSITLTAPSVPNVIIPYSLEIVGTDTEGLFELVNITDAANVPQWHTIYESSTPVIKAELSEAIQAGKLYKITISGAERIVLAIGAEHLVYSQTMLGTSNGVANSIYNNVIQFDCGIKSYDSTSTANTFKLKTASQYMINASGIQDIQFIDNDTTSTADRITFTKVEVYR